MMTLHSGGSCGEYSFHQSLTWKQGEEKNAVQGWYLSCKRSKLIFSQVQTKKIIARFFTFIYKVSFKGAGSCERLWSKMEQD